LIVLKTKQSRGLSSLLTVVNGTQAFLTATFQARLDTVNSLKLLPQGCSKGYRSFPIIKPFQSQLVYSFGILKQWGPSPIILSDRVKAA